jgi:type VI secretion system protein ImpI/type VI secretion system protein
MTGLRLRVVQAAQGQAPSQPEIALGDATLLIGRGEGNALVLPDPLALVSRQHCRIDPLGDGWQLTDLSTNGSFVNDAPVGKGGGVPIHAGDTVRLGDYILAVEESGMTQAAMSDLGAPGSTAVPLRPDPNSPDPFELGDIMQGAPGHQINDGPAIPPEENLFEDVRDPDAGRGAPDAGRGGLRPPPRDPWAEHQGTSADAPAPFESHSVPLPTPEESPAAGGLPSNWMDAEPPPPPTPRQAVRPAAAIRNPRAPAPPPPPAAAAPAGDDAALSAFLEGAGITDIPPGINPVAAMHALGESNRLLLGTLVRLLAARRALKSEFRISQTVIGARDNNPLKFEADEGEMVMMLMGAARRGFQGGPQAMIDACQSLEQHQIALLAGLRAALEFILHRLSPQEIESTAKGGGLLSGKAKQWERFQQLHDEMRRDVSNNLAGQVGQAFATAYEAEANRHR